ncbi:hypothetical protein BDZ89DRAFT_972108, partial [Hymenopellis radicata]
LPRDKAHLCPVRWMIWWLQESGITSGYVFRKFNDKKRERVRTKTRPLTQPKFIEYLRRLLTEVGVDNTYAYACHSFRRGGVQFCAHYMKWSLHQITKYGGWSTRFTSKTVHLYMLSADDDEFVPAADAWRLGRHFPNHCTTCGR